MLIRCEICGLLMLHWNEILEATIHGNAFGSHKFVLNLKTRIHDNIINRLFAQEELPNNKILENEGLL